MALTITVTDAGRAALVNAANTGTAPVTIAQVGLSGTAVVPAKGATALPGEFKRLGTISGGVVADDTIHVIVRDESTDVFAVRSLGLYLGDGTLFAIYGQADVLAEKSGQAMLLIAVDVKFEDIDATTLTFGDANFLNPPATTTTMGVVELSTGAEAIAGTSSTRVPPEKAIKDAVFAWLDARFGANNSGIWHPGNDGAGSGMDADLLDGQQGSYYTNIVARLGYAPWGPNNDGSGSGLDADLLDGQDGSYYTDIAARLGYSPLNAAGDTMTGVFNIDRGDNAGIYLKQAGVDTWRIISNGANLDVRSGAGGGGDVRIRISPAAPRLDLTTANLIWAGNPVFHIGNDGSGSGMDADLLDGQHGSYYQNLVNSTGTLPNARLSGQYTGISINTLTNQYWMANSQFGLHLGNSDIIGVNGIYFSSDVSNADGEGLNFLKSGAAAHSVDAADYDILRGPGNGTLLWNGAVIWNTANDGAGSGMDSDLLDGQHGSYYQNLANSTGTLPNARISGAYDGVTTFTANEVRIVNDGYKLSVSGQLRQIQFSAGCLLSYSTTSSRFIFTQGGTDILYLAANGDLSGPGGSAYDRIISSSMGEDGYIVYASGLKILWGRVNVNQDSYSTVTYPFTFDTTPCPVFPTLDTIQNNAQQNTQLGTWSRTGFQIYQAADRNGSLPYHVIGK